MLERCLQVERSTDLGVGSHRVWSPVVWPWAGDFSCLGLTFLVWKVRKWGSRALQSLRLLPALTFHDLLFSYHLCPWCQSHQQCHLSTDLGTNFMLGAHFSCLLGSYMGLTPFPLELNVEKLKLFQVFSPSLSFSPLMPKTRFLRKSFGPFCPWFYGHLVATYHPLFAHAIIDDYWEQHCFGRRPPTSLSLMSSPFPAVTAHLSPGPLTGIPLAPNPAPFWLVMNAVAKACFIPCSSLSLCANPADWSLVSTTHPQTPSSWAVTWSP